jgi:hypothetical protein
MKVKDTTTIFVLAKEMKGYSGVIEQCDGMDKIFPFRILQTFHSNGNWQHHATTYLLEEPFWGTLGELNGFDLFSDKRSHEQHIVEIRERKKR